MKLPDFIELSNTTIKKAHIAFNGHTVNTAVELLSTEKLPVIVSEFVDDWDNPELRRCLCYMIGRTLNDMNFPYGIYK